MLPRRPATAAGHAPETDLDDATKEVLTPANSQLLLIDHQPLPAFAVQSIDRQALKSNVVALARAARLFDVPTTLSCMRPADAAGHLLPELRETFPDHPLLERTAINAWEEPAVRHRLADQGRRKLVVAGLWTDTSAVSFGLAARREANYEIHVVADASGASSRAV
jgi:nicotinamidase-related amidase